MTQPTDKELNKFVVGALGSESIALQYERFDMDYKLIHSDDLAIDMFNGEWVMAPILMHLGKRVAEKWQDGMFDIQSRSYFWSEVNGSGFTLYTYRFLNKEVDIVREDKNEYRAFWTAFMKAMEGSNDQ